MAQNISSFNFSDSLTCAIGSFCAQNARTDQATSLIGPAMRQGIIESLQVTIRVLMQCFVIRFGTLSALFQCDENLV
jgi:hypothetical protein